METIRNQSDEEHPIYLDEAMARLSSSELAELIACALAEMERRQQQPH